MTNEQIKYSLATQELKLSFWEKTSHYLLVIYMLITPILYGFLYIKDYIEGVTHEFRFGEILIIVITSLIGIFIYKIQRNRLKFKVVNTMLSKETIVEVIEKVAKKLEWYPQFIDDKVFIAITHPKFRSGSWGEQITILFDNNRLLVNSICDPNKNAAIFSMGRNKKNENSIIEEINNYSDLIKFNKTK